MAGSIEIGSLVYVLELEAGAQAKLKTQLEQLEKSLKLDLKASVKLDGEPQAKQAFVGLKGAADPLKATLAALANEQAGLRSSFIATGQDADKVKARLLEIKTAALAAAQGVSAGSREFRQASLVAAQSERTLAGMRNELSRLGLGSQVHGALIKSGLIANIASLSAQLGGLGPVANNAQQVLGIVSGSMVNLGLQAKIVTGLVGAAAVGVAGLALAGAAGVRAFAPFEDRMKGVQAVLGATEDEYRALSDAALDSGAKTRFSATEAAGAIEELAKAGLTAAEIMGGGLKGSTDLAAAAGIGLAESSGIATTAMKAFGLAASDLPRLADTIAAAANSSALDVSDLGQAMQALGPTAKDAGLSFEQTAAALAKMADQGIRGSDAGTSLKTLLQSLTPNSKEAAGAIETLGVRFFDAQGRFRDFSTVSDEMRAALAKLTPEMRATTTEQVFGTDAARAAGIVFGTTGRTLGEYTEQVSKVGEAARNAAIREDTLQGAQRRLAGTVETLSIKLGEDLAPAFRITTDKASDFLQGLSDSGTLDRFGTAVGALALKLGDLLDGLGRIDSTSAELRELMAAGERVFGGRLRNPFDAEAQAFLRDLRDGKFLAAANALGLLESRPAPTTGLPFHGPNLPTTGLPSHDVPLPPVATIKANTAAIEEQLRALVRLEVQGNLTGAALEANRNAQDKLRASYKAAEGDMEALGKRLSNYEAGLRGDAAAARQAEADNKRLAAERVAHAKAVDAQADSLRKLKVDLFQALADGKVSASEARNLAQRYDEWKDSTDDAGVSLKEIPAPLQAVTAGLLAQAKALGVASDKAELYEKNLTALGVNAGNIQKALDEVGAQFEALNALNPASFDAEVNVGIGVDEAIRATVQAGKAVTFKNLLLRDLQGALDQGKLMSLGENVRRLREFVNGELFKLLPKSEQDRLVAAVDYYGDAFTSLGLKIFAQSRPIYDATTALNEFTAAAEAASRDTTISMEVRFNRSSLPTDEELAVIRAFTLDGTEGSSELNARADALDRMANTPGFSQWADDLKAVAAEWRGIATGMDAAAAASAYFGQQARGITGGISAQSDLVARLIDQTDASTGQTAARIARLQDLLLDPSYSVFHDVIRSVLPDLERLVDAAERGVAIASQYSAPGRTNEDAALSDEVAGLLDLDQGAERAITSVAKLAAGLEDGRFERFRPIIEATLPTLEKLAAKGLAAADALDRMLRGGVTKSDVLRGYDQTADQDLSPIDFTAGLEDVRAEFALSAITAEQFAAELEFSIAQLELFGDGSVRTRSRLAELRKELAGLRGESDSGTLLGRTLATSLDLSAIDFTQPLAGFKAALDAGVISVGEYAAELEFSIVQLELFGDGSLEARTRVAVLKRELASLSDPLNDVFRIAGAATGALRTLGVSGSDSLVSLVSGAEGAVKALKQGDTIGAILAIGTTLVGLLGDALDPGRILREELEGVRKELSLISAEATIASKTVPLVFGGFGGPAVSTFELPAVDRELVGLATSIESAVFSGVEAGFNAAIESGNIEDFGKTFEKSLGQFVVKGLVEGFLKSAAIEGILGPALNAYFEARKTSDPADDLIAIQGLKSAAGLAAVEAEAFFKDVLKPVAGAFGLGPEPKPAGAPDLPSGPSFSLPPSVQIAVFEPAIRGFEAFGGHVGSFGTHVDRLGGYVNRLVTDGIRITVASSSGSTTAAYR